MVVKIARSDVIATSKEDGRRRSAGTVYDLPPMTRVMIASTPAPARPATTRLVIGRLWTFCCTRWAVWFSGFDSSRGIWSLLLLMVTGLRDLFEAGLFSHRLRIV